MGHIVVAGKNTGNKAVKRLGVKNKILIHVDKSAAVIDIIAELYPLLYANDRTLT